jgi:predicted lactoylglutathione lyase
MVTRIFINLPVRNIEASRKFFTQLGFSFNPRFSSPDTLCMVISEHIFAMLLQEARFAQYTQKEICNAHTHTEVLIALDAASREEVDDMVRKAVEAGGTIYAEPQDHGYMYGHSFADLDGHQWELGHLDMASMPE